MPTSASASHTAPLADDWDTLPPESAYFLSVNRSKRSLTLNLKSPEGLTIIKELIKRADILVENYVPGKLAEMGLGYEACRALNDRLIYASVTGWSLHCPRHPSSLKPGAHQGTDKRGRMPKRPVTTS